MANCLLSHYFIFIILTLPININLECFKLQGFNLEYTAGGSKLDPYAPI